MHIALLPPAHGGEGSTKLKEKFFWYLRERKKSGVIFKMDS